MYVHVVKGTFSYLQRADGVNIGGHEGVSTVVEVDDNDSSKYGVKAGDRVAVKWISWACQECELCTKMDMKTFVVDESSAART